MAEASFTLNVERVWDDTKNYHVVGWLSTASGSTYATNGVPVNLTNELIKSTMIIHAEVRVLENTHNTQKYLATITDGNGNFPEWNQAGTAESYYGSGIPAVSAVLTLASAIGTELANATGIYTGLIYLFYGIYSKNI